MFLGSRFLDPSPEPEERTPVSWHIPDYVRLSRSSRYNDPTMTDKLITSYSEKNIPGSSSCPDTTIRTLIQFSRLVNLGRIVLTHVHHKFRSFTR